MNNVRLDEIALKTIADLNTSKSDLQLMCNHLKPKNTLLQFAGTLAEEDANQLLTAIANDKKPNVDCYLFSDSTPNFP